MHFIYLLKDFSAKFMMLIDGSEFFLCLKRSFIVYMESNQNISKSLKFNECKTILKLKESLLLPNYFFQTLIVVHPVCPCSPIGNEELQPKL